MHSISLHELLTVKIGINVSSTMPKASQLCLYEYHVEFFVASTFSNCVSNRGPFLSYMPLPLP